ncbi:DUF1365 domain-containing protein [Streptomyces sp. SID13666]|uniref:DUF1365 domain-containing protein n=1 Tax=Streptomyces TaxID=1883 RepID=UPI0013C18D81|nr:MULTISPECIES: DUF1365 domain-containing protein [Streptomyces]MCZ4099204.1 DUF1365 domain-containing protein [Streptomyces sp. H39-C1]NEA56015.1 DUF1365 domain-containing protein [Streptomyces sp. SID13666]NEA72004.1 DUF1365 domain-containing protein [Streptomyces sp. SID13588]
MTAALYECVVSHVRTAPLRYSFRHRTYLWLVDLDALPRLPRPLRPLARFEARDHFGGTAPDIRAGLDRFLAAEGVEPPGGRVLMLTAARVFGHVFNPLTVYWCHRSDGSTACVVAEVHNTYGERHCYLLRPDTAGRAGTAKDFYVSPFFPVDGEYRMQLPEPGARLALTVHLERAGTRPFTATLRGERRPATTAGLLRTTVRHPWSTATVSALIRMHGVLLYLRGLPVRPRPPHRPQEGVQ